jgi:hypothetical protein
VLLAASRATSNGPDWTDIAEAIAAVESYHNVTLGLHVSVPVVSQKGKVRLLAVATRTGQVPAGVRPSVSRSLLIGSSDPSRDTATIFRLVHELDRDCSQMWAQAGLFT